MGVVERIEAMLEEGMDVPAVNQVLMDEVQGLQVPPAVTVAALFAAVADQVRLLSTMLMQLSQSVGYDAEGLPDRMVNAFELAFISQVIDTIEEQDEEDAE